MVGEHPQPGAPGGRQYARVGTGTRPRGESLPVRREILRGVGQDRGVYTRPPQWRGPGDRVAEVRQHREGAIQMMGHDVQGPQPGRRHPQLADRKQRVEVDRIGRQRIHGGLPMLAQRTGIAMTSRDAGT
ncbi:Uncharacterised protein [Mycobacteroides abscessus subsp. abscessus]|nr:Uncharacterised protein [Mycobacteroides abscessus subsp. abscessus]